MTTRDYWGSKVYYFRLCVKLARGLVYYWRCVYLGVLLRIIRRVSYAINTDLRRAAYATAALGYNARRLFFPETSVFIGCQVVRGCVLIVDKWRTCVIVFCVLLAPLLWEQKRAHFVTICHKHLYGGVNFNTSCFQNLKE